MANIIATTTIIAINTKAYIFVSLSRGIGSGDRTFHFDCGIDLSRCGIAIVECFWGLQLC